MDNVFKHLKRKSKQIISLMLVFCILTENPLSAYASTKATPSNIPESSASIESTDTNIDIDTDFGVEDFETNPDQDPDHGPGIDSTTPTYPYYRPVVDTSTIPDEIKIDSDDIDAILGAGANCIDDFDPDSLVPLTPEQVEAAYNPEPVPEDPNLANVITESDSEVSAHVVGAVLPCVGAAMMILWAIYGSNITESFAEVITNQIETFKTSFSTVKFAYLYRSAKKEVELTQQDFVSLKNKLDNSSTGSGYSVSLTEKDKAAFAYAMNALAYEGQLYRLYSLTDIDASNFNIKPIDSFKHYYLYPYDSLISGSIPTYQKVIYTPNTVAFGATSGYNVYLYYHNAATADYGYSTMKVHNAEYKLSSISRLYEYNTGADSDYYNSDSSYTSLYEFIGAMPFPVLSGTRSIEKAAQYIPAKDFNLLSLCYSGKICSLNALMDLTTVSLNGDIIDMVKSEKNVLQTVTGVNSAAGVVTAPGTTTKPGTETKPGTGTGTGSGTTTSPDYSGSFSSIIGIITSILAGVNIIPNIFTLFQALPTTIKDSIVNAIKDIPFFESALLYLSLISTGLQDIVDWDIEAWIGSSMADLGISIDNIGDLLSAKLANLPNIDNLGGIIGSALANSSPLLKMAVSLADIVDSLKTWSIDNYGDTFMKALELALSALGLDTLSGLLSGLKDLTGTKLTDIADKLKALLDTLSNLKIGADLSGLSDILREVLTALGLGSLLGVLTNILSKLGTFSLTELIDLVKTLPAAIVAAITTALPNWRPSEPEEGENDSGFHNFLNLFMIALLIIILLMILFINCLRFIVLVFNIPASSALIHSDMMQGIEYMKNLQLPVFGVSLWTLLLSCAYFVIFMTVIAAIRRKIDKMHI
ncbi:hypothetical protein [Clostridium sp. AF32-12BH]|uniref:hypothetical protein n=1 Tax=Clostridium sp. AF32-12BH TaxID=2292006 RepID=UPI0015FC3514|nr:hypothetical protein [Clostridium sp. AF32-12BH]